MGIEKLMNVDGFNLEQFISDAIEHEETSFIESKPAYDQDALKSFYKLVSDEWIKIKGEKFRNSGTKDVEELNKIVEVIVGEIYRKAFSKESVYYFPKIRELFEATIDKYVKDNIEFITLKEICNSYKPVSSMTKEELIDFENELFNIFKSRGYI